MLIFETPPSELFTATSAQLDVMQTNSHATSARAWFKEISLPSSKRSHRPRLHAHLYHLHMEDCCLISWIAIIWSSSARQTLLQESQIEVLIRSLYLRLARTRQDYNK